MQALAVWFPIPAHFPASFHPFAAHHTGSQHTPEVNQSTSGATNNVARKGRNNNALRAKRKPSLCVLNTDEEKLHRRQGILPRRLRGGRRCHGRGFRGAPPRREVAPAQRARGVRVQPHVDAVPVEQVPARRQPPHRLAAPHVLQAHRAQRAAAAPVLAAAPAGVGGSRTLVSERWRHVGRRRANEPGPPPRHRGAACVAKIISSPRAHGVSYGSCRGAAAAGSEGCQPADDAAEHDDEASDGAGLDDAGGGREDAEQEH
ncbi:hypothetical protein U9M48_025028 [Paspalum notatum var. saurae]|uniref:Uncharacterized protein n=1 Tax=Paspalum notatum var. saurae TaxID=547442 RepID=A0AAQ3WWP2_PASNO